MKDTLDIPIPILQSDGTVTAGWAKRTQPSLVAFILRQTQREAAPGQPSFVRDYLSDTDDPAEADVLTSVLSSQPNDLLVRRCLSAGTRVDQGVKRPYGPHGTFNGYQWAYLYRPPGDGSAEAADVAAGNPNAFHQNRFAGDAGPQYPFVQKNLPLAIGAVFFTGQLTPDAASLSLGCGYIPACGNALPDTVEECDDGCFAEGTPQGNLPPGCDAVPLSAGDGCSPTCRLEACGNGILDPGEQCDNGAANSNITRDACRLNCMNARCGDGVTDTGEQCDDGNTIVGDGCTNTCTLPRCGDGIVQAGEGCDDGNLDDTDTCLNTCVVSTCGDGHKKVSGPTPEGCDDGLTRFNAATNSYEWCYTASPSCLVQGNDGCTVSCVLEAGFVDDVKADPIGNPVNPTQLKRSAPELVVPGL